MHRSIMIESTIEKKYDFTLMVSTLLLLGWGTVMIYSTSAPFAEMQYQNSHFFLQPRSYPSWNSSPRTGAKNRLPPLAKICFLDDARHAAGTDPGLDS